MDAAEYVKLLSNLGLGGAALFMLWRMQEQIITVIANNTEAWKEAVILLNTIANKVS